ncbi:MAG: acylphosphatase [Rhodospirillales bacterium]|jgi:acylphosphatase|nr:acylphosphatase [Rhodospirillales bacterium]
MTMKSVRAIITGRVQGVWYRAWTCEQATTRNLDGWVRNNPDGSVEAIFSGPVATVDDMISACHEGPRLAQVNSIDTREENAPADTGFHQV